MDPMTIQNHLQALRGAGALEPNANVPKLGGLEFPKIGGLELPAEPAPAGSGFKQMLSDSIDQLNNQMLDADTKVEDLASGRSANIHGTLLALQKADISFRLFLQVRGKVVKAYEEVMRMQV